MRQIVGLFCKLTSVIFSYNGVKGLRVTKNIKEIKFEGVCREIESKKLFQKQELTKYQRLTLVFM